MEVLKIISAALIPAGFVIILIAAVSAKTDAFSAFSEGIRDSLDTITGIFPPVFALMTAISFLKSSGLLGFLINLITPLCSVLKIPPEILPNALLRPLSGSGSLALLSETLKTYGPDSLIGITACVITGSTETTFYTLTVYFGGADIRNMRYSLKAALIADFFSIATGIIICRFLFS